MIPLFVANAGDVKMSLADEHLELEHARFDLMMGGTANLTISATPCDEEGTARANSCNALASSG